MCPLSSLVKVECRVVRSSHTQQLDAPSLWLINANGANGANIANSKPFSANTPSFLRPGTLNTTFLHHTTTNMDMPLNVPVDNPDADTEW